MFSGRSGAALSPHNNLEQVCDIPLVYNLFLLLIDNPRMFHYPTDLRPNDSDTAAGDHCSAVYFYGDIDVGGGVLRRIFATPSYMAGTESNVDVAFQTCILVGADNNTSYREVFASATYVLELHDESAARIVFFPHAVREFHQVDKGASGSGPAPTGGGKGAAKGSGAAPKALPISPISKEAAAFLMDAIFKALSSRKATTTHGEARFRLDQLLDTAADKRLEFEKKRRNEAIGPNDTVVIQVNRISADASAFSD